MLELTPEGLEAARKQHARLDPKLAGYSVETLASLIISCFNMIDFYEVGGREPRRTKQYLEVLAFRRQLAKDLQDPKYPRIMIESIFNTATNMMIEASVALKERIQNGEDPAIPYAKRASRRKPRSLS